MASQSEKSTSHRRNPHSMTTSLFANDKKGGSEFTSPITSKPATSCTEPSLQPIELSVGFGPVSSISVTEPIAIPSPQIVSLDVSHKQKKLAPNTFNTHYRSISRSMNDLGNIFSRGRSPPNREDLGKGQNLIDSAQESSKKRQSDEFQTKHCGSGPVPQISVVQHSEQLHRVRREGWVNVIDSHTLKKGLLKDAWKLHHGVVSDHTLMLFKPPSHYHIRAFEVGAHGSTVARPRSAPAIASSSFNASSLRHKSVFRHPEIILGGNGTVEAGTLEALCHELMFTTSTDYVECAVRLLSGWTGPEIALSVLIELCTLKDTSLRSAEIVRILADATPGLLLQDKCYNCARLLVEKGIGANDTELAKSSRRILESRRSNLSTALRLANSFDDPRAQRIEHGDLSSGLNVDEFMSIKPDILAGQIHLFHLKYFRSWNPAMDISLLLISPHLPPPVHRNPLVFNTRSFHFLGERVLNHILTGDSTSLGYRSSVLLQWIQISQLLKTAGDMVGYLAIIMAILSPPIVRLQEIWSTIEPSVIEDLVQKGSLTLRILERRKFCFSGKSEDGLVFIPKGIGEVISSDDAVPYFGDLLYCLDDASNSRGTTINFRKMASGLQAISDSIRRWKREWPLSNAKVSSQDIRKTPEVRKIQMCLEILNFNNQNPPSFDSTIYFDKSLVCEPSTTGMYLHSHYHQRLPLSTGAIIPLMLTDIRASFSLFDRCDTLAIAGSIHKKTTGSHSIAPSISPSGPYPLTNSANQTLCPPIAHSSLRQPTIRRTRSFPPSKPIIQTTGFDELDFTTHERTAVLQGRDNAMLRAIHDVTGVGQQLFYSKDGELVLKTITDGAQSRPRSVIELTSKGQLSASRRYSSIPNDVSGVRLLVHDEGEFNTAVSELSLHSQSKSLLVVVPKGGTLERLVDILVLGVEDFSKRMITNQNVNTQNPLSLKMDKDVFTVTFFATFRSFCSPVVLIDYLKKRLLGSRSAATFSQNEGDDVVFPDWTGVDNLSDEHVDWDLVGKIHIGILDAVHVWITEFYLDFYCDKNLGESFIAFLQVASKEISIWKSIEPGNLRMRKCADDINVLWNKIKEKFKTLAFTPLSQDPIVGHGPTVDVSISDFKDMPSITQFIETLDARVFLCFKVVKLIDWMLTFELLEVQSAEPMGFFVPKITLLSNDDEDPIQNIFFVLNNVRHRGSTNTVLESFPKSVRHLCKLHSDITDWILSWLVDPKINVEKRAERISAMLKALSLCRQRMSAMDLYENSDVTVCRHVPSFVGSAIATALVRPECRIFSYAWQVAVKLIGGSINQIDTLEQVIPNLNDENSCDAILTPCVGWMLERLLEIVCHVPNMVVENNRLINFDKRRYVFNFVTNLTDHLVENQVTIKPVSIPTTGSFDMRSLKDLAIKENQLSRHGKIKIFGKLLQQEQEKLRRDAKQRDAMERLQRQQLRAEHRRQPTGVRSDITEKKSGKRLGVNSLFKAVRPISMALTGQWTPPQDTRRVIAPSELPPTKGMERSRKPFTIIDLKSISSISIPRGTLDQFIWRLTSENGVGYWFQAPSEKDMEYWLKCISEIRGVTPTDGESIDVLTVTSNIRNNQKVFGVTLEELCTRDNVEVPVVVESLLSEIESRGLAEVGIYRVPGSLASINALREALDSGEHVKMDDDQWYDINVVAGVFKLFMRELPDQAQGLGLEILHELRDLTAEIPDENDRVSAYKKLMEKLPSYNYQFLRRVYSHLAKISGNQGSNKMSAVNLAIVFGMGLSPTSSSPLGISPDLGLYQTMVKTWINHAETIFSERGLNIEVATNNELTSSDVPNEVDPIEIRSLVKPVTLRRHIEPACSNQAR